MELPKGFNTKEVDGRNYLLQLIKNLYRKKQARRVWDHHINDTLHQVGFKQSAVNYFVWYQYETIFFYCVDDGIFMEPDSGAIDKAIE